MPTTFRQTRRQVLLNGAPIDNVLSCRWSFGFDQRISEATVVCAQVPTSGGTRGPTGFIDGGTPLSASYYDQVDIIAGASAENNVLRFSGLLLQYDYSLYPRAVSLTCRGRGQLVADFENTQGDGISLETDPLLGGIQLAGMTDQEMVTTILNTVSGQGIGLDSGMFIDGTGVVLGKMIKPEDVLMNDLASGGPFVWKQGETALAFIEKLDQVCLGFRLYEGSGSLLFRAQVFGRPNADSVWTFTEGVDILEARATRTIIPAKNRVRVSGYDFGLGFGPVTFALQESNPFQTADQWHSLQLSSPMIERAQAADTGTGLSCEDVANWQMAEVNRELVKVQLTTPLDLVVNPGDTISLLSPSRLGTTEPLWVMTVEGQIDDRGAFSQTLTCVGGGTPTTSVTPPWELG